MCLDPEQQLQQYLAQTSARVANALHEAAFCKRAGKDLLRKLSSSPPDDMADQWKQHGFRRQGSNIAQTALQPGGSSAAGSFYRQLLSAGFLHDVADKAAASAQPNAARTVAAQAAAATSDDVAVVRQQAVLAAYGEQPEASAAQVGVAHGADEAEADAPTAGLGSASILPPFSHATQQGRKDGSAAAAQIFVGPSPKYGIPADNIGFKMLRKAGWQPGAGLGVESQGRRVPLEDSNQKGRRGLGADAADAAAAAKRQQAQQAAAQEMTQARPRPVKAARITLPEDSESLDAKVKRHRQVLQSEADDAAGKAIQRYMYMAFRDSTGEVTTDTNPLKRRSRLTATNPLL